MNKQGIVVIDAETSGPDVFENDLLAVYMCTLDGKHDVELYVRYEHELNWGSIGKRYFNKYQQLWEKEAVTPAAAVQQINRFLGSLSANEVVLAGHNVSFDLGFLRKLSKSAATGLERKLSHRVIDTHSVLAFLVLQGKLPQYTLKPHGAAAYFNIETSERHFARDDAVLVRKLLSKMLDSSFDSGLKTSSGS